MIIGSGKQQRQKNDKSILKRLIAYKQDGFENTTDRKTIINKR